MLDHVRSQTVCICLVDIPMFNSWLLPGRKNEHLMISRLQCIRIGKLDLRVKGVQGQMEMEIMGKSWESDGKMPSWRPLTLADTD